MIIRKLSREELNASTGFIWNVFCEYEDRNEAFHSSIEDEEYLDMLTAYGAFENGSLAGIIASRSEGSHIALFFVDGVYQGKGIGRKLWEIFLNDSRSSIITVNSSRYAVEIYRSLGFRQKDSLRVENGIQYVPMEYPHFIDMLKDKDDRKAYAKAKEIASSEECYPFLEEAALLLRDSKSYVRMRSFMLCCGQAAYDREGKIKGILPDMLAMFHDEKPTNVRQCLREIKKVMAAYPELKDEIISEAESIDLSRYKDSMVPLINKDILELKKAGV